MTPQTGVLDRDALTCELAVLLASRSFPANRGYFAELRQAALEIVARPQPDQTIVLDLELRPFGVPEQTPAEVLSGARDAYAEGLSDSNPRIRSAAALGLARLQGPVVRPGDLAGIGFRLSASVGPTIEVTLQATTDEDGRASFPGIPANADCRLWLSAHRADDPEDSEPAVLSLAAERKRRMATLRLPPLRPTGTDARGPRVRGGPLKTRGTALPADSPKLPVEELPLPGGSLKCTLRYDGGQLVAEFTSLAEYFRDGAVRLRIKDASTQQVQFGDVILILEPNAQRVFTGRFALSGYGLSPDRTYNFEFEAVPSNEAT